MASQVNGFHLVVSSAIDNPIESGTKKKFVAISGGCASACDMMVKCEIPIQGTCESAMSAFMSPLYE